MEKNKSYSGKRNEMRKSTQKNFPAHGSKRGMVGNKRKMFINMFKNLGEKQ